MIDLYIYGGDIKLIEVSISSTWTLKNEKYKTHSCLSQYKCLVLICKVIFIKNLFHIFSYWGNWFFVLKPVACFFGRIPKKLISTLRALDVSLSFSKRCCMYRQITVNNDNPHAHSIRLFYLKFHNFFLLPWLKIPPPPHDFPRGI